MERQQGICKTLFVSSHPLIFMTLQNTHLEHPEDLILTGNLDVLEALYDCESNISVKIDGAPAIVWGTNPETGNFFVGTKSVFNKRKIKINESHDDIDMNHGHVPEVCDILHACFHFLPQIDGIIQGDFIGFGGQKVYRPNTITYEFPQTILQKIIIAPHTMYHSDTKLSEAVVIDETPDLFTNEDVYVVQPCVDKIHTGAEPPPVNMDKVQFMDKKQAKDVKQVINSLIKNNVELTDSVLFDLFHDIYLVNLYQMVIEIKEDLMESLIVHGCPQSYIETDDMVLETGEGFVLKSIFGMIKLVNREAFSYANFTSSKFS